jgi:hypothetical protein
MGCICVKKVFERAKTVLAVLGIVVAGALVIWGLLSLKGLIFNAV